MLGDEFPSVMLVGLVTLTQYSVNQSMLTNADGLVASNRQAENGDLHGGS